MSITAYKTIPVCTLVYDDIYNNVYHFFLLLFTYLNWDCIILFYPYVLLSEINYYDYKNKLCTAQTNQQIG